jgi:hypothetical protein
MISGVIDDYHSPRARYNLEDSLPISRDEENNHHFYMHANFFSNWWPEELQQNEWQDVYPLFTN